MNSKQKTLRVLCVTELVIVMCFYFLSPYGLRAVMVLRNENHQLEEQIAEAQDAVVELDRELNEWSTDSFYTEQYAREKLAMGRKNEEIYLR